jgi:hypothetical protein
MTQRMGYLPNETPPAGQNILLGFQHVLTMFPATVFVAALTGFHVGTVLFASGVSTIVALLLSRRGIGKFIPLFYGSSFSYIAAYLAVVSSMTGGVPEFGVPVADEVLSTMQAGIVVTGLLNIVVGFLIRALGKERLDIYLPSSPALWPPSSASASLLQHLARPRPTGASLSSPCFSPCCSLSICRAAGSSACSLFCWVVWLATSFPRSLTPVQSPWREFPQPHGLLSHISRSRLSAALWWARPFLAFPSWPSPPSPNPLPTSTRSASMWIASPRKRTRKSMNWTSTLAST